MTDQKKIRQLWIILNVFQLERGSYQVFKQIHGNKQVLPEDTYLTVTSGCSHRHSEQAPVSKQQYSTFMISHFKLIISAPDM